MRAPVLVPSKHRNSRTSTLRNHLAVEQYESVLVCITALITAHVRQTGEAIEPLPVSSVVRSVQGWKIPTAKIVLITQDETAAKALHDELRRELLLEWIDPPRRQLVIFSPSGYVHPLNLAWQHRDVMGAETGFSLFAYLEHDIDMRWEHIQAWAEDEEVLRLATPAPGSPQWSRGFYRWYARYLRPDGFQRAALSTSAGVLLLQQMLLHRPWRWCRCCCFRRRRRRRRNSRYCGAAAAVATATPATYCHAADKPTIYRRRWEGERA